MEGELLADQPLGQKLIKKGFWLYFFTFLITPVGYFIKVIVSNTFSVEDVGLFYSIISFLFIISLYNDLGLTEALQYFLPKYWINKEYNKFKTITILTRAAQCISGAIIAGGLYFGAPRLAEHYFKNPNAVDILQIMSYMFFGWNFIQVFSSFFAAFQNVIAANLMEAFRMYTILFLTLYLWLEGILNMYDFSILWVIATYVSIGIGLIIFIKRYRHTLKLGKFQRNTDIIKKQMKYARWVFLGANVSILLIQINQQMSIFFLGSASAGYFTNFISILNIFMFFFSPIIAFLFPLVTELLEKKEIEKFNMLLHIFYKYFSVFAIIFSGLFLALGPEIGMILFGKKFIYSGSLVSYTAPFLIINLLYTINFYILGGMGKVKERVGFLFRGLLANILTGLIGIYILKGGMIAIVGGMIIGRCVLFLLTLKCINKQQKINFDRYFFIKNILTIGLLTIIVYTIKDNLFIAEDGYRFQNIGYLLLIGIGYLGIIGGFNYPSITLLMKEIKAIKKTEE